MSKKRVTSPKVAKAASKNLKNPSTGSKSKTASGSALSQAKQPNKVTGKKAASDASSVLRDGRSSKASKSVAASTLSQRADKTKK